jgi:hypothetical protein
MDDGEAARVRTGSFAEHNRSRLRHFRCGRVKSPSPITGGPSKQHFTSDLIVPAKNRLILRSTGILLILWPVDRDDVQ